MIIDHRMGVPRMSTLGRAHPQMGSIDALEFSFFPETLPLYPHFPLRSGETSMVSHTAPRMRSMSGLEDLNSQDTGPNRPKTEFLDQSSVVKINNPQKSGREQNMLIVRLTDKTIGISFRHDRKWETPIPGSSPLDFRITSASFCEIYNFNEMDRSRKWKLECSAVLNEGDNFNRATGRKVALTRALGPKGLNLSKFDRTTVWNAYFKSIQEDRKRSFEYEEEKRKKKLGLGDGIILEATILTTPESESKGSVSSEVD